MKKLFLIGLLLSLTHINAYAKSLVCPFTDYFTISAPSGYAITSLLSDGNIVTANQSSTNFTTSCRDYTSRDSGKAYLTVSVDKYSLCTIHLIDGPYEMNPIINFVNCVGRLKYTGIEHAWGTYNYKLKFSH